MIVVDQGHGSNWPAWLALLVAGAALAWQVGTYFAGKSERDRKEQEVAALRRANTEALIKLAENSAAIAQGTKARPAAEQIHAEGAQLSARLSARGRNNSRRLIVTNKGPGGAQLRKVEVLSSGVAALRTGLDDSPIDLLPDEEYPMVIALSAGVAWPMDVLLTWVDSRGEQERNQAIGSPG
jgi:hypothetical protein